MPTVGRFELNEELGRGAMGVVYRARDPALKRDVALKLLAPGSGLDPEQLERFRREAEVMAGLRHPHLVRVHELGSAGGRPYVVMDLIPGTSLAARLGPGECLPPREAAALVLALAQGVEHAHQHGVVHRDIKPANVLLNQELGGHPLLTDFGLARLLARDAQLTESGTILGTPGYMSPEQAEGRSAQSGPPSDVYGLGALLYRLLTGRPPFGGATTLQVLQAVSTQAPTPPSTLRPGLDPGLERICLRCLQKPPEARYPSAAELAGDIQRYLAGEASAPRRRAAGAWALLLALLAGGGGGLAAWRGGAPALGRPTAPVATGGAPAPGRPTAPVATPVAATPEETPRAGPSRGAPLAHRLERLSGYQQTKVTFRADGTLITDSAPRAGTKPQRRLWTPRAAGSEVELERGAELELPGVTERLCASGDRVLRASGRTLRWETPASAVAVQLEAGRRCSALAASRAGEQVAAAWLDDKDRFGVSVYDLARAELAFELQGLPDMVQGLAFAPDDAELLIACGGPGLRLWRLGAPAHHAESLLGQLSPRALAVRGEQLAIACELGTVLLVTWDMVVERIDELTPYALEGGAIGALPVGLSFLDVLSHKGSLHDAVFSPAGDLLYTVSGRDHPLWQELRVWDTRARAEVEAWRVQWEEARTPTRLAIAPDGRWLAVGFEEGGVEVWRLR